MAPFIKGEKTHPEFVHSTVPFDLKRAQNNAKGYAPGTLYEPKNGIETFALAAFFDPLIKALFAKLQMMAII